jgi:hypothetical protein
MLAGNFAAMTGMGDEVLKPFLQDVIQFNPLMRTMAAQVVQDPGFVPQLMMHVVSCVGANAQIVRTSAVCADLLHQCAAAGGTFNTWRSGDDGRTVAERLQVRF